MAVKVSSRDRDEGEHGEVALARGKGVAMRMWRNEPASTDKPLSKSPYETVGYVIAGQAELVVDGQTVPLEPGVPGWCRPAPSTPTASSRPSPRSRRRRRPRPEPRARSTPAHTEVR